MSGRGVSDEFGWVWFCVLELVSEGWWFVSSIIQIVAAFLLAFQELGFVQGAVSVFSVCLSVCLLYPCSSNICLLLLALTYYYCYSVDATALRPVLFL